MVWPIIMPFAIFFVVFFFSRMILFLAIREIISNTSTTKRKKGQSFFEWLFYLRFQDVIPLILKLYYYGNMVICAVFFILQMIVVFVIRPETNLISRVLLGIDFYGSLLLHCFFAYHIGYTKNFVYRMNRKQREEYNKKINAKKRAKLEKKLKKAKKKKATQTGDIPSSAD